MTINWNIIFKPAFAGLTFKKTYLCVRDDSGAYSGWLQKGIWTIQVIQVPEEPAVLPEITITDPINGQVINAEP